MPTALLKAHVGRERSVLFWHLEGKKITYTPGHIIMSMGLKTDGLKNFFFAEQAQISH